MIYPQRQYISIVVKELLVIVALLTMIFVYFYDLLIGAFTLMIPPDTIDMVYSNYYYIASSLKSGIFPLWDPHLFSGFSLAAYPQYGIFYPINILFWLWPYSDNPFPPYAYEYLVIFHVFLGGWFMYWLGRALKFERFVALAMGIIFMFNANFLQFLGWGNAMTAFAWFPLIMLLAIFSLREKITTKIYPLLGGLSLGMLILAAPSQPFIQILLLIGIFYLFCSYELYKKKDFHQLKKISLHLFIILGIGFLIGAISLLPMLEFTPYTIRFLGPDGSLLGNEKMPFRAFTRFSMSIKQLLGFILPPYSHGVVSESFIGLFPFVFSVIAVLKLVRKNFYVKIFSGVILLSLLYAFNIILPIIAFGIPLLDKMREPERYMIFVSFSVPILAAYGLKYIYEHHYFSRFSFFSKWPYWLTMRNMYTYILVNAILLGILFFDLGRWEYTYFMNENVPLHDYLASGQLLKPLIPPDTQDIFRVTAVESATSWPYGHNFADIAGFYDTLGYGNPLFAKSFNYRNSYGYDSRYYDMLNVKYFVANEESTERLQPYLSDNLVLASTLPQVIQPPYHIYNKSDLTLYENKNRLGYAWVVDDFRFYEQENEDRVMIEDPQYNIDLKKNALVHKQWAGTLSSIKDDTTDLQYTVDVLEYRPNTLQLKVVSNKNALLVLSELFYPGWNVFINGVKGDVLEVNNILRGTMIQKGENIVEYQYMPESLRFGFWASLVGVILVFFGIVLILWKRKFS